MITGEDEKFFLEFAECLTWGVNLSVKHNYCDKSYVWELKALTEVLRKESSSREAMVKECAKVAWPFVERLEEMERDLGVRTDWVCNHFRMVLEGGPEDLQDMLFCEEE